jgi:hypothetical protein
MFQGSITLAHDDFKAILRTIFFNLLTIRCTIQYRFGENAPSYIKRYSGNFVLRLFVRINLILKISHEF